MVTYVGKPQLESLTKQIPVLGQGMFVVGTPAHRAISIHYLGTYIMDHVAPVIFGTQLVADKATWKQAEYLAKGSYLKPEDVFTTLFYDAIDITTPICAESVAIPNKDQVNFLVFGASTQLEGLHYVAHSIITDSDDAEQKSLTLCDLLAKTVTAKNIKFTDRFEKFMSITRQIQAKQEQRLDALEAKAKA